MTEPLNLLPRPEIAHAAAAARVEQVRDHATANGLAGVLAYSWRRGLVTGLTGYSPGFVTNTAAVWIPAEGVPALGVRFPFEVERATAQSRLAARCAPEAHTLVPDGVHRVGVLCGDSAMDEGAGLRTALAARHIDLMDLTSWFDDMREHKTSEEVVGLRLAAEVGRHALIAARATVTGDTDYQIAAHVEGCARRLGATSAACLVGIGRGTVVTEPFGATLGRKDAVGLELNMVHGGFFSHVQATVLPADADDVELTAVRVAREARNAVVAALRPGARVSDAVAAGDAVLAARGLLTAKEYDFGHGIGYDTPEHPRLLPGSGREVVVGSVIAVHCGLRRPGGETAYTGGPVLVGPDGAVDLVDDPVVVVPRAG